MKMNFAEQYFNRFNSYEQQIQTKPATDLNMVVVIPCFNEPNLIQTLDCFIEKFYLFRVQR